MANIFDYLLWRGDLPLSSHPFHEVDGVILARLAYMPFEYLPAFPMTLAEAAQCLLAVEDLPVLQKDDLRLLEDLSKSPRFQNMVLSRYVNELDEESQTQFSAISFRLDDHSSFLSFRGTDNTLIGWKEDFNMCFVCPVPAQTLAVDYLRQAAGEESGVFYLGGHSKGGNLAVYAAAFSGFGDRVTAIYNYDGPGFDESVLQSPGYQAVYQKVHTYVPQSSIVGMMLSREEAYTIVHSTQSTGIWQHDICSWEVQRDHFLCLETVDQSSRFIEHTLKGWIADLDHTQREQFVDAIYAVLSQTNADTLRELTDHWFTSAMAVLRCIKDLDEPTQKLVTQTLLLLAKSAKTSFLTLTHPDDQ